MAQLNVTIKYANPRSTTFTLTINTTSTVSEVKWRIWLSKHIPFEAQALRFSGIPMEDPYPVSFYGIDQNNSEQITLIRSDIVADPLHLMFLLNGGLRNIYAPQDPSLTIAQVKQRLLQHLDGVESIERVGLVFRGASMMDDQLLSDFPLSDRSQIVVEVL